MVSLGSTSHGGIAQLVEHTTENRGVPGSSPGLAILGISCKSGRRINRMQLAGPTPAPARTAGRTGRLDSIRSDSHLAFGSTIPADEVSDAVTRHTS